MKISFPDAREESPAFGEIYRPSAEVLFQARESGKWYTVTMVVDTGADVTLLPRWLADALEIDLERDCQIIEMNGIGGGENIWLFRHVKAQLGPWQRWIPVGFVEREDVPPLLGRKDFFETFRAVFDKHAVTFSESRARRRAVR